VVILPPGALVALDARKPVPSPATFHDLRPGRHVLRASLKGSSLAKEERVKLDPGPNQVRIVLVDPFASNK
jgi:hypothetical protein